MKPTLPNQTRYGQIVVLSAAKLLYGHILVYPQFLALPVWHDQIEIFVWLDRGSRVLFWKNLRYDLPLYVGVLTYLVHSVTIILFVFSHKCVVYFLLEDSCSHCSNSFEQFLQFCITGKLHQFEQTCFQNLSVPALLTSHWSPIYFILLQTSLSQFQLHRIQGSKSCETYGLVRLCWWDGWCWWNLVLLVP